MTADLETDSHAGRRRWKALALLCTANFMVILDSQIVILAVPSIERDLGFTAGSAQWVMSAYLLAFGGLLLLGGRLADLLGRRRVFMAGTVLFLVSSLLSGLAWLPGVLVMARVVQGVSAAIMAPSALSILMTTFQEGRERNRALGVWSGTGGLGATAALLIGGALTEALGWPWVFFLNVPVAIGLLVLSPILLNESRDRGQTSASDPAGAVTVTAALVLLVYAVVEAPEAGWTSAQTIGLLAGSAVLLTGFALIESRSAAPLVPPRIFRSRTLVGGNLAMLLIGMLGFGMSFTVAQYAQQVLGYSPLLFGVSTMTMAVMAVIGAYAAQIFVTWVGFRPVAAAALVLLGAGSLLLAQVSVDGSYFGDLFFGLLIFGPGLGGGTVAATAAALSGVAEREAGLASATNTAAFQLGGALGTAIVSTVAVSQAVAAEPLAALTEGSRAAFTTCVAFAIVGLLLSLLLLGQPRDRDKSHTKAVPKVGREVKPSGPDEPGSKGPLAQPSDHPISPRPRTARTQPTRGDDDGASEDRFTR